MIVGRAIELRDLAQSMARAGASCNPFPALPWASLHEAPDVGSEHRRHRWAVGLFLTDGLHDDCRKKTWRCAIPKGRGTSGSGEPSRVRSVTAAGAARHSAPPPLRGSATRSSTGTAATAECTAADDAGSSPKAA